jgi:predicted DNA-binding transcriptional regulator YafY
MYHPTTRVLTVLELLQTYRQLSSSDLADRLEVSQRSVRRYVTMLQDLGMPVESRPGRHGGYRLRPGYKLPPLMFTNSEALAVTLGLLTAERIGLTTTEPAIEGALAKIERVLPDTVREQIRAVQDALVLDGGSPEEVAPSEFVLALGQAVQQNRRIWVRYDAPSGETARLVDPYGLVSRDGRWYAVGWCHLREDVRVFRVDRIEKLRMLSVTFEHPAGFDAREYVVQALDERFTHGEIEVLLVTTLDEARRWVSMILGTLREVPEGVLLTTRTGSHYWLAHFLIGLPFPVVIRKPVELKHALERIQERIADIRYEPETIQKEVVAPHD